MKRRKTSCIPAPRTQTTQAKSKTATALIRLNTHSIRNKALKDYQKAEKDLERLKIQLRRYHEEDRPGFRSWVHQHFGNLLTRQRELAQALDDKKNLLFDIDTLSFRYRLPKAMAYKKLLWRRSHPAEAEEEDRIWEEAQERKRQRDQRRAKPEIFPEESDEDFDSGSPFQNEDFSNIPDDEWEDFSDYFEEMTGIRPPKRATQSPKVDGKTAKDLYRTIVRRLHPDHHGQMTEAVKSLWHEAQAAYRRKDTNALYNILARCEGGEAGLGAHSAVSLIQNLTRQLKHTLRTTKQEIRQVKRDPAWDYKTRIQDPKFINGMRRQLEMEIADGEWNLQEVEELLKQLEREANRPTRHTRRNRYERDPLEDLLF